MKLNGTQKFSVLSKQVFNAVLDPEVLKASIPGASAVSYAVPNEKLEVEVSLPFPGLHGPFTVYVNVAAGSVLTYNANAKLEGLIAIADNPLSQGIVKGKLSEFFKNLEKAVTAARV